jgi:hypothetical protein
MPRYGWKVNMILQWAAFRELDCEAIGLADEARRRKFIDKEDFVGTRCEWVCHMPQPRPQILYHYQATLIQHSLFLNIVPPLL